jgi:integrase
MFRSDSIDADGVLRYHRQKTGVEAVIPLEPETLALLRTIPLDKDCMPEMPFRRRDINMVADHKLWYVRLKELFAKAGVTEVRYKEVVKAVSPKCLRHTFATAELAAGQDIPSVSKMLGHSTTAQTEKVYLPWVPQRDEAHIKKVREAQQKAAKNEVQVVAQGGKRIAVQ